MGLFYKRLLLKKININPRKEQRKKGTFKKKINTFLYERSKKFWKEGFLRK